MMPSSRPRATWSALATAIQLLRSSMVFTL
jgi:hypothetical protein